MRRVVLISVIAAAVVLAIGLSVYFWLSGSKSVTSDALRAIPTDAGIVIRIDNTKEITDKLHNQNQFWKSILEFDLIADADRIISFADSLRQRSTTFDNLLKQNPLYISVHPIGKGIPELLLTSNLPANVNQSDIFNFIESVATGTHRIVEKDYNGVNIISIEGEAGVQTNFSVAVHRGVVMASASLILVESAIGQMETSASLMNDKTFLAALKTAGTRVDGNVFVNHQKLPKIFALQANQDIQKGLLSLSDIASWSELDLTVKNEAFFLNGFSQVPDSANLFYHLFTKQKPVQINIADIIPSQTAAFVVLGISDLEQYLNDYHKYLEGKAQLRAYHSEVESINKKLGQNIQTLYNSFFSKELGMAFIPLEGETRSNSWFVIAGTKGQSQAQQIMLDLIESYARKNNLSVKDFERTFRIDKDKSAIVYRMPVDKLHRTLFGSLFDDVNDKYFTFIDSYIVFGSSVESLSRFILTNVHNKQLSSDLSFKQFSENLSPESNFTAYINPGKAESLYSKLLEPKSAEQMLSKSETLRKIQGLAIQLSGGRAMIFNNICANYSPVSSDEPKTVWETRLDTTFAMKPQIVINHTNQNREIFVQDRKNNIYLINDIGRVLWKKPLNEPLMGEVTQIDVFRNGKLQLLFNTQSHLYIIDRNGNNIDGFPVKLRSLATNPVSAFDYEGNRDFRFFIAGEDRRIYAYDRNGNIIPGWDFERSEKPVYKPLQHFRVSNRDYIVFADENRPYILDRRGNERVKPSRFFSQAKNSTFVLEENSSRTPPRLVTTDSMGFVRFIYLDGKVDDQSIRMLSSNHSFDYQDVDADGLKDFIFVDDNKLYVYRNSGKELFTQKFSKKLEPKSIYFHFGARDRKLGVMSRESDEIFLINGDGKMYKGFPLKGITPFSIGRFASTQSKFNLIVGSSTGFVLNYAVQ